MRRLVSEVVTGLAQSDGAGVRLTRVLGPATIRACDPFLMLDAFDSRRPEEYIKGFPWHPHRGIETITYLVAGAIEHGDSLGNRGTIRDGGCQWMTAGRGIIHQEMPLASERMLGLQLWLNLPRQHKMTPPAYHDIPVEAIPRIEEEGGTIRVVAGVYREVRGGFEGGFVRATVLDVSLRPGQEWRSNVAEEDTVIAYILEGGGAFDRLRASLGCRRAVVFGRGSAVHICAGDEGVRFVLLAGRPLGEPVAWGGPIVMNTQAELDEAFASLDAGTFAQAPS